MAMLMFFVIAILGAVADWRAGRWGAGSAFTLVVRLIQGVAFWQVGLNLDAKVLIVENGVLAVTTWFRRPFRGARETMPIRTAALEWIGRMLVLQTPDNGDQIRLGRAPEARPLAEWLVAQGAPHPVGG
jgi:hypothetical protein